MKNIFVFASILATLFIAACSNNDSKAYDESLSPATSTKPVTPLTIADTLLSDTATARPATKISLPTATTTTLSGNSASAKAGLNPAHGLPGHRCDIAVGASLSTPVKASTPQVTSVTTNNIPSPVTSPISSPVTTPSVLSSGAGGKLNPPHGQPGHDCAVEVGKPLKN